jgi:hypothetical protein
MATLEKSAGQTLKTPENLSGSLALLLRAQWKGMACLELHFGRAALPPGQSVGWVG